MYKSNLFFVMMISLFICGCASDEYYKDKATEAARDFVLNDIRCMSHRNEACIKYTYPKILASPISANSSYDQICLAWELPSPKITVLVYGASKTNLRGWFPARVIFRKYEKQALESEKDIQLKPPKKLGKEQKKEDIVPRRTHS